MGVFDAMRTGLEIGGALGRGQRQREQQDAQAGAFSTGGWQGAAKMAGSQGNFEAAQDYQQQATTQQNDGFTRARETAQVLGRVGASLQAVPMEQRQARVQQMAPMLERMGIGADQLAQADWSDQGLQEMQALSGQLERFSDIREVDGQIVGIGRDGSVTPLTQPSLTAGAPPGHMWTDTTRTDVRRFPGWEPPSYLPSQVMTPDRAEQLQLPPGAYLERRDGDVRPINTQRGSPLERARATADVERLETLNSAADTDASTVAELGLFAQLNTQESGTGPGSLGTMGVGNFRPFQNDQAQQMEQIIARLTPAQRVPGSGATSDFDARMFQAALPGLNRSPGANNNIIEAYRRRAQMSAERAMVADAWLESGSLQGFDTAWRRYVNQYPIYARNATPENPVLNTAQRPSFVDWAQANGVEIGSRTSEQMQTQTEQPAANEPPKTRRDQGYDPLGILN